MEELTICWSITTKCNMNCSYCFSKYDHAEEYHISDRLLERTITKIMRASKKYSIRLVILGGEPTLHPRLKEICERCLVFCRKVIIVTNGTKPEIIHNIPKEVSIDLSYHGQDLSYFLPLIEELKKTHFTQILCVLDKYCKSNIITLHDWCEKTHTMFEAIPIVDNVTELAEDYEDTFLNAVRSDIYYKIPMFSGVQTNLDVYVKNRNNIEEDCLILCKQSNIAIYANGYYYPCCKNGMLYHKAHIEGDQDIRLEILCRHRYCMENRGCLDFAGWRQDPDGFLFGNNE